MIHSADIQLSSLMHTHTTSWSLFAPSSFPVPLLISKPASLFLHMALLFCLLNCLYIFILMLQKLRYLSLYDWHFPQQIFPRSINFPTNDSDLFFVAEWYSILCICHICFIHSSVNGHSGWFWDLGVGTGASINIGMHLLLYMVTLAFPDDTQERYSWVQGHFYFYFCK